MDYTQLIAAIIAAGPDITHAIADLVKQNPQQQGQTDEAYIADIQARSKALSADTKATDAAVENS
jgi:hypothetical protein